MQDSSNPGPVKPKRNTAPATDKATLALVYTDYINSNYKSISELASRYGMHQNTLLWRSKKEKWEETRLIKIKELQAKVSEKTQSLGTTYLENTIRRMKRYEKIIDASQEQLGTTVNKDGEVIPVMDCEAINDYTLSEQRINAISMLAHRIPAVSQVDLTSKGQSLGESIVTAIAKLRDSGKAVDVTMQQAEQLADFEVVPDTETK